MPVINCYYQNVRGLRTNTAAFKRNVILNCYDIVLITEIRLNDSVLNAELFDDSYMVWRRDRCYESTGQAIGGEILIQMFDLDRILLLRIYGYLFA